MIMRAHQGRLRQKTAGRRPHAGNWPAVIRLSLVWSENTVSLSPWRWSLAASAALRGQWTDRQEMQRRFPARILTGTFGTESVVFCVSNIVQTDPRWMRRNLKAGFGSQALSVIMTWLPTAGDLCHQHDMISGGFWRPPDFSQSQPNNWEPLRLCSMRD